MKIIKKEKTKKKTTPKEMQEKIQVEDTRIDEIGEIILNHRYEKDPRDMNALKYSSYLIAKKVLEYLTPELEKAKKYDELEAKIPEVKAEVMLAIKEFLESPEIMELKEKAKKYDALLLIKDPVQIEREHLQELVMMAEKWNKLNKMLRDDCTGCPYDGYPCNIEEEFDPCKGFIRIVDALEGGQDDKP